ncbi:MAG: YheT family hydrolase [Inquilinaceae bacterium]
MPDGAARVPGADYPPFRPRAPWWGGDLQTVRSWLIGLSGPDTRTLPFSAGRERLSFAMPDGTGDRLIGMLDRPLEPGGRPLAILIHGLTGCAESGYIRASAGQLLARGHCVLRLNLRGAGPSRSLCRQHYHAGRTEDLRAVLNALPAALTTHGTIAVGYSLGGNLLLKYLGEDGAQVPLDAAVSVSAPIDLAECMRRMMMPRSILYHRHILARMKQEVASSPWLDRAGRAVLAAVRTVYDFDDRIVAPRNGFGSADRYYATCSANAYLGGVAIPTLVIHAADDPWIPMAAYRRVPWAGHPCLTPLLPDSGGHVGFHSADGPPAWHDRCLAAFLDRLGTGAAVPQDPSREVKVSSSSGLSSPLRA